MPTRVSVSISLAVLVLVAYLGAAFAIFERAPWVGRFSQVDFNTYYAAASLLREGRDIYDGQATMQIAATDGLAYIPGSDYIYPPYLAALLAPALSLGPQLLGLFWFVAGLAALAWAVWLLVTPSLWRTGGRAMVGQEESRHADFATALVIALVFVPTTYSFFVGQVNAFLMLFIVAAFYNLRRNRQFLSGAFLAVAILIKAAPVLIVAYFLARRKFRALMACGVTTGTIVGATWPYLGQYVMRFLTDIAPSLYVPVAHPVNQSLNGFFSRLFSTSIFAAPVVDAPQWVGPAVILAQGVLALIIVVQGYDIWKSPYEPSPLRDGAFLGLIVIFMLIASPRAWENLFLVLAFMYVLVVKHWWTLSRLMRASVVISYCSFVIQRLWDPFVNAPDHYAWLRGYSIFMSLGLGGALLLFGVLWRIMDIGEVHRV